MLEFATITKKGKEKKKTKGGKKTTKTTVAPSKIKTMEFDEIVTESLAPPFN